MKPWPAVSKPTVKMHLSPLCMRPKYEKERWVCQSYKSLADTGIDFNHEKKFWNTQMHMSRFFFFDTKFNFPLKDVIKRMFYEFSYMFSLRVSHCFSATVENLFSHHFENLSL